MRILTTVWVVYGMVDVSKKGYGAALHIGSKLRFHYGQWGSNTKEE